MHDSIQNCSHRFLFNLYTTRFNLAANSHFRSCSQRRSLNARSAVRSSGWSLEVKLPGITALDMCIDLHVSRICSVKCPRKESSINKVFWWSGMSSITRIHLDMISLFAILIPGLWNTNTPFFNEMRGFFLVLLIITAGGNFVPSDWHAKITEYFSRGLPPGITVLICLDPLVAIVLPRCVSCSSTTASLYLKLCTTDERSWQKLQKKSCLFCQGQQIFTISRGSYNLRAFS